MSSSGFTALAGNIHGAKANRHEFTETEIFLRSTFCVLMTSVWNTWRGIRTVFMADVQIGELDDAQTVEVGMQVRHAHLDFLDAWPAHCDKHAERHGEERSNEHRRDARLRYHRVRCY